MPYAGRITAQLIEAEATAGLSAIESSNQSNASQVVLQDVIVSSDRFGAHSFLNIKMKLWKNYVAYCGARE